MQRCRDSKGDAGCTIMIQIAIERVKTKKLCSLCGHISATIHLEATICTILQPLRATDKKKIWREIRAAWGHATCTVLHNAVQVVRTLKILRK